MPRRLPPAVTSEKDLHMKQYQVVNAIKHGTKKATKDNPNGDLKMYEPGETIDLDDVHADPLLAAGDIVASSTVTQGAAGPEK